MKIGLIALAVTLASASVYAVKHHQPALKQVAGPPGTAIPCPPLCVTKPITEK